MNFDYFVTGGCNMFCPKGHEIKTPKISKSYWCYECNQSYPSNTMTWNQAKNQKEGSSE